QTCALPISPRIRLARAKFEEHSCADHPRRQAPIPPQPDEDSFGSRARKLLSRGYKPKDAVELVLEEILLEHRYEPKKDSEGTYRRGRVFERSAKRFVTNEALV